MTDAVTDAGDADPTAAARAAFWADGACVVRGVVPDDVVDAARRAVAELDDRGELADLSALAGADEAPRFRAGVDHWRASPALAAIALEGIVPALVAAVLGADRLWLYEDSVLVKDAGSTVPTRWHSDDGYFHVEGEQMATLWLPLDPAPQAAGALRFVRGSHTSGHRYRPTLFVVDDPIPGTEGEQPPALDDTGLDVIGEDLDVGDLSIHHARTLHAAGPNTTGTARRALSLRYCGPDVTVRVKPGAPARDGYAEVEPGTPLAAVADRLGVPEAVLAR